MKQIKKLSEVNLTPGEMRNVIGERSCSCEYGTMGTGLLTTSPPKPPQPHCGCGGANCILEDGGTGFMLGMNWNDMSLPVQVTNNNSVCSLADGFAYQKEYIIS
jgi:hypothetical protein